MRVLRVVIVDSVCLAYCKIFVSRCKLLRECNGQVAPDLKKPESISASCADREKDCVVHMYCREDHLEARLLQVILSLFSTPLHGRAQTLYKICMMSLTAHAILFVLACHCVRVL
jgi:hypothetical protein